jgi:hypothetical protein
MNREIIKYIFIYNDEIIIYEKSIKVNCSFDRYSCYEYLDKFAIYGLNNFLRDKNILNNFKVDFIIIFRKLPYYMYSERTSISNENYIFNLKPIIKIIEKNKFEYEDTIITNTYRCNNLEVKENIKEFKIIDDGVNEFDESHANLLDNLSYNVEKIYLLYDVKNPITNLPFSIKKIFVYENCNMELIKIPFGCEIVKI